MTGYIPPRKATRSSRRLCSATWSRCSNEDCDLERKLYPATDADPARLDYAQPAGCDVPAGDQSAGQRLSGGCDSGSRLLRALSRREVLQRCRYLEPEGAREGVLRFRVGAG